MPTEQHTVTIDGVKYDFDTAMKDPVLKARYTYLADDPKGNLLRTAQAGLQKAIAAGKQEDIDELTALVAKYENKAASYSPEATRSVDAGKVDAPAYNRDNYLNTNNFEEESNAGSDAERAAINNKNIKSSSSNNSSDSASKYPKPGETIGDLFTNPHTGQTFNWRTGELIFDPKAQEAQASGQNATGGEQQGNQKTNVDPGAPTAFFSGSNLSVGSKGAMVSQLQQALGGLTVDGNFGPKTLAAVKAYQLAHGLTPDGIVGPQTMAALNAKSPSQMENVTAGMGSVRSGMSGGGTTPRESEAATERIPSTGNAQIDSLIQVLNNQSPQKSFTDVYKEVYKSLGLDKMNSDYKEQTKEYTKLQNEKNDEKQEINNNPWYSDGVRLKKLQELDEKYEGREIILQNKLKLLESNISNSRADAQFVAGQTMEQLNQSAKLTQDVIFKAIDIAESLAAAESKTTSGPASVQEYEYAVSQGYSGSFSDYQNEDANRKISIAKAGVSNGGGGGLALTDAQKAADIRSIRSAFDNEQIVKDYNTSNSSINTLRAIGVNSKSPADDIAFIYAFAKIMDPNSVVREGEYKTVQDYAQSLVQRYTTGVKRVVDNTNFLTVDAKTKMLATLEAKVGSQKKSYENLSSEYQRQINDVYAGKPVTITNYLTSSPSSTSSSSSKFDWLQNDLSISGTTAYLPRSVWDQVKGADKDALLAEIKADGFTLLIK